MPVDVPPEQTYSVTATPAAWQWNLAAGYHEITLTPQPLEQPHIDLSFAGFPLFPLREHGEGTPAGRRLAWPLFVPLGGKWTFNLSLSQDFERHALTVSVRRLPSPQPRWSWEPRPRGLWLEAVPEDEERLRNLLREAAARGASFALISPELLERPPVKAAMADAGLLALTEPDDLPPAVEWEGDAPPFARSAARSLSYGEASVFSGWMRGGALSPLADEPAGDGRDEAASWFHHLTGSGALTLKHAAWSDLAEVWYHPFPCSGYSPAQALMLARVRGMGSDDAETPLHTGSHFPGEWQIQVPSFEEPGLLHVRWTAGQGAIGSAALRSTGQTIGTGIPAAASGQIYYPRFTESGLDGPSVLVGRGTPPPETAGFVRSRLAVRRLWTVSLRTGRRRWPEGVRPLEGYEQPSRTKDALIGLRIAPCREGTLVLRATVEMRSAASIAWHRSPAAGKPENGSMSLGRGTHRLLFVLGTSAEGWAFRLNAPRRLVRLRSIEATEIPLSVLPRMSGPYWVETDIVSRMVLNERPVEQRWSVRMMRNQPWIELAAALHPKPIAPRFTRLTFELPRYDRVLVNGRHLGGIGSVTRPIRLVALKDSDGHYPDLTIIPTEESVVWTIRQTGTTLTIETTDERRIACIIVVGKLERWGGANTIRSSVNQVIRPVVMRDRVPVVLKNDASKAVAVLAKVNPTASAPYWVREGGWWRRIESQVCGGGHARSRLLPLRIPGRSSVMLTRGNYLNDVVRPIPGSQCVLSLSEPERDGVAVRANGASPFGLPLGVEFRHPVVSVTCNGHPWHVHDGSSIWLPAAGTRHRLRVTALGEPTPVIVNPCLPIISTRWTGARLTVRLAEKEAADIHGVLTVRFPHRLFTWMSAEGGYGELERPGVVIIRPTARTVHVRFVPRTGNG